MKNKILITLLFVCTMLFAFGMTNASAAAEGIYIYRISNGEAILERCDKNASDEIVIPNTFEGCSVTSIGPTAFDECHAITSITIPDSVTVIGNSAFRNCSSLKSITIPDNVISIGNSAFYGCSSLANITLGESVEKIDNYAFYGCSALTNVTISDSVISFGQWTFYGCSSLTNVTIGNGVEKIDYCAFYGCSALTNVTIGDSVASIGDYVFRDCSSLKNITIDDSVTKIGMGAFYGCNSLTDVYYTGKQDDWDKISISSYNDTLKKANIHYGPFIETTLSNNNKSFTITPTNLKTGKTVILALYDGEKFIEMQSAVYTGEAVHFTTTKNYTKAKVMVWENLTDLKSVCNAKTIE